MSPSLSPAGLRGARFQAGFAKSSYVEIGWDLWGTLPHFLPQRSRLFRCLDARDRPRPAASRIAYFHRRRNSSRSVRPEFSRTRNTGGTVVLLHRRSHTCTSSWLAGKRCSSELPRIRCSQCIADAHLGTQVRRKASFQSLHESTAAQGSLRQRNPGPALMEENVRAATKPPQRSINPAFMETPSASPALLLQRVVRAFLTISFSVLAYGIRREHDWRDADLASEPRASP
jgi:hypothetical protein